MKGWILEIKWWNMKIDKKHLLDLLNFGSVCCYLALAIVVYSTTSPILKNGLNSFRMN